MVYDKSEDKQQYPYAVTGHNITKVNDNFKNNNDDKNVDIKIGDIVDEWKYGGPLSMRKGEIIIRDGIEIYSRMTAIS